MALAIGIAVAFPIREKRRPNADVEARQESDPATAALGTATKPGIIEDGEIKDKGEVLELCLPMTIKFRLDCFERLAPSSEQNLSAQDAIAYTVRSDLPALINDDLHGKRSFLSADRTHHSTEDDKGRSDQSTKDGPVVVDSDPGENEEHTVDKVVR